MSQVMLLRTLPSFFSPLTRSELFGTEREPWTKKTRPVLSLMDIFRGHDHHFVLLLSHSTLRSSRLTP